MSDKQALRQKAISDAEQQAKKQRFALFSQPPSNAIGDDGQYKTKIHPRDQTGKPITSPRNFQTNPTRTGQLNKSNFGPINSLATHTVKDQFIDPGRRTLQIENQAYQNGKRADIPNFKPGSNYKDVVTPAYQYVQQKGRELDPKRNRNQDGGVKTKPRNFYSNPQTKVIAAYFKPIPYIEDPYQRAKKMESQKRKKEKSLEGQKAFKPNSFTSINKVLNPDNKVYGLDVELKAQTPKETKYNIFPHQKKWKSNNPGRSGLYGFLQPFPAYMQNPPKQVKRKSSQSKDKQIFKSMNSSLTAPSPSISQHPINLKRSFNHSFSHRF